MDGPLTLEPLFFFGPVPITGPVATTWGLVVTLAVLSRLAVGRLSLSPGKIQTVLELFVETLDAQIRETTQSDPARYRALIGTIFLLILFANWSTLIPGIEPPTAHIETDAALALVVFVATIGFGISNRGLRGYLGTFAEPSWVMIPLNVVEQITRTFALIVRLFGNVMSGVFVVGIVLSLAGLFVPIPFMALELLTGAIQAYIFTVLAMVFIAGAAGNGPGAAKSKKEELAQ